jgi:hypothetical protein
MVCMNSAFEDPQFGTPCILSTIKLALFPISIQSSNKCSAVLAQQFAVDDLVSWLSSASPSASLKKYPVPGTCTWIREKEEYVKWRNSPASSLLLIYGRLGRVYI